MLAAGALTLAISQNESSCNLEDSPIVYIYNTMCIYVCNYMCIYIYIYIHTLSIYPHNINIQKLGIAGMTMSGVKCLKRFTM